MSYNRKVTADTFSLPKDMTNRIRRYIYLRWFILIAAIVPGLLSVYIGEGMTEELRHDAVLGGVAIALNGVFYIASRVLTTNSALRLLSAFIFTLDIALITYFIYSNGGIESRSIIMYVIPIVMSAAVYGKNGSHVVTLGAMFAYDGLILCNYFGLFPSLDPTNVFLQTDFAYVMNTIIFFNSLIVLTSLAVDFIARLLVSEEETARQRLGDLKRAQAIAKFGSWEWDRSADVITWSDELYKIFGVKKTKSPMSFEQYLECIHPDDRKMLESKLHRASLKNMEFTFNHRIVLPNGTIRYIRSDGQSVSDASGNVVRMIGTARDITEAKLLENAKNDFVALTSHQLRTPATIVKQYATMLKDGYVGDLNPQQKKFMTTIYESNERQINIINDLLNIARIDSGDFKMELARTDLVGLLSEITTHQSKKYKTKKQKLIFESIYKKVYCNVDSGQIRMAIENLLDNAHKYTPAKKDVRIAIKRKRGHILIFVSDEGIGIPSTDIHKIFKMFSRIENPAVLQEEGTGIGLYWAKKIITMHGGTIEVTSEHNKGTTFTIDLPCQKAND